MKVYKPVMFRRWHLVALALRGFGGLLGALPLLLIVGVFVAPISPHMLVEYTYEWRGSHKHMIDCDYLGVRGWARKPARSGKCDVVAIIDRRVYGGR